MWEIIILTSIGFIISIILALIDFKENDLENKYLELLPLYNCGVCGFNSCEGMVEQMLDDVNNYKKCKPLKGERLKEMEKYLRESGKI